MKRREFLGKTALGLGAAWLGSETLTSLAARTPARLSATDIVTLGKTGIQTTRLACGTGTVGVNHSSNQAKLGIQGLADLLWAGYDQGLRFIDCADSYGTHPHVKESLKRIPRDKVTILTKSWARDADGMRSDLERFRRELNVDHIDVLLMHCLQEDDWTTRFRGAMDVLSEAKQKGIIRAHGCSCHTIEALRAAAQEPWVEVDLARLNPIGSHMDAEPDTVLSVLWQMRAAGKGIVGMKILGQGDMGHRQDEALKYALSSKVLDAFTIGAESRAEQTDLIRRIAAVAA
ncbi:MAG: aldo/keto reductase [Acidobacteriia bacterium]|nr:aldo/keto reductase [Terriglobia bacterium]